MNFSETFKQSSYLCKFSPDNNYIANATSYRLIIRDVKSLQVKAHFSCLDNINHVEWASDSMYVLCALFKRGFIQVWSLENPSWICKIDHGSIGLVAAQWAPDARHILATSDFKLRISVWSLISKSVSYIKYPKHANKGLEFSKNGKYLAVAERRNFKDFISIFVCDTWEMIQHFETDTKDLFDLSWSPNNCMIAVWDTKIEYKVVIYSLDGRLITSYSAYDCMLGIKSVAWTPSNQFLAIGSYDQSVRLLNNITWKPITELKHVSKINNGNVIVYQEQERKNLKLPWESGSDHHFGCSQYVVQEIPFVVPSVRADPEKPNPKLGVGTILFSFDNKFIATKNDNQPNVLWIWDLQKLKLCALVVQCHPIKALSWDPCEVRLAFCSGNNKVYMWSPAGCLSVEVPGQEIFLVTNLSWYHTGDSLLLMSKDQMCFCYLATTASVI
ncbi:WD repeat-containing protein WRAP73 isoform X1 [Hydra vulgaris]|uniref:WD repeat-containing protein WRAP73 n=1 Tax=Hydra vulgaris TaxID=6087 RepID=T2M3W9_HYDVU|nr:WD repeat-containing protein WRAP73-like [Hydra vulgaris]